jgi:translation initiation factor eIF-2B subunit alpha/methylthioribose-1-phosphate isomerase
MKFRAGGVEHDRPCFWISDHGIVLIDQRALPMSVDLIRIEDTERAAEMIRTLAVRGAPAIGSFGAWALALAIRRGEDPETVKKILYETRPTAVDLEHGLDLVMKWFKKDGVDGVLESAGRFYEETIETCRRIGQMGSHLISNGTKVMTHCNAGALATLDWGTALAPIRFSSREGMDPFVWVSETRPLLQGARLTAWELKNEGIRHRIIVDSASASLIAGGEVDLIIVGADRVCVNGDFANKIGTLSKAIAAREFGVPFYVAVPWSTFDRECSSGEEIPIEVRGGDEISFVGEKRISPTGSECHNPAFDVTPAKYVTGFITPDGVISPNDVKNKIK